MEDITPNLSIDEHIDLLPQDEVNDLFLSLADTVSTQVVEDLIDTNLTEDLVKSYLHYMDEDTLFSMVEPIIDLTPTVYSVRQLALTDPDKASTLLEELLYWKSQGRV